MYNDSMDHQDIEQVAKIFDSIITSPSQAVQDAFRNLTVLATLSRSNEQSHGPFEDLFKRLGALEYELKELRREVQIRNNQDEITLDYPNISDNSGIQLSFADNMGASSQYQHTWIGNITIGPECTGVYSDPVQVFKIT